MFWQPKPLCWLKVQREHLLITIAAHTSAYSSPQRVLLAMHSRQSQSPHGNLYPPHCSSKHLMTKESSRKSKAPLQLLWWLFKTSTTRRNTRGMCEEEVTFLCGLLSWKRTPKFTCYSILCGLENTLHAAWKFQKDQQQIKAPHFKLL